MSGLLLDETKQDQTQIAGAEHAAAAAAAAATERPPAVVTVSAVAAERTARGARAAELPLDIGATNRPVQWIAREPRGSEPGSALVEALRRHGPFAPRTFFWIACESRVARTLRRELREAHGVDLAWIKASGYWQRGAVGAHEKIADEA